MGSPRRRRAPRRFMGLIGNNAYETIPRLVVEYQSLGIDSVTGATLSSVGLLNAVRDRVAQADGDTAALEKVTGPEKKSDSVELDADIGGNALVSGGVLMYVNAPDDLGQSMTDGYKAYFEQTLQNALAIGAPQKLADSVQKEFDVMTKLYRADTVEGLAEQIGIDPDTLAETVATFNDYVRRGSDPDFGRTLLDELYVIDEAPYYACPGTWAMHITNAGVQVDTETYAVLDGDGKAVDGLYAIGEVKLGDSGITVMADGIKLARQLA